jgi:hypothetical protein
MKAGVSYRSEVSSDVAFTRAMIVVNELFPSADAETKTDLFLQLTVHLEACIHAYCDFNGGKSELIPTRNERIDQSSTGVYLTGEVPWNK